MSAKQSTFGRPRRRGHEKSTTGCLTCRVRRVKCDESKPFCNRCTSTGRRCDGPVPHSYRFVKEWTSEPKQQSEISPLPKHLSFNYEFQEGRAFNYFVQWAASRLAGPMDADFWAILVPQLSRAEPIIWNSVLAISCLYEHPQIPSASPIDVGDRPAPRSDRQRQALRWYNKAVRDLNLRMEQNSIDLATVLLTCILFVCFECQQDNISNALALLEKGFKLCTSVPATTMAFRGDPVLAALTPVFTRHAVLSATFASTFETGHWMAIMNCKPSELDIQMSNLEDARHMLYKLMEHGHAYLRLAASKAGEKNAYYQLFPLQEELLGKLDDWRTKFANMKIASSAAETRVSSILLAIYEVSFIWIASSLSPLQSKHDPYNHRFQCIVHHTEVLLSLENGQPLQFTFEMGVIPPLFFVGMNCRDSNIRRKVLALLGRAPEKESLWKALPTAKIIEKAMEMEKEHLTPMEYLEASQGAHHAKVCQTAGTNNSQQFAFKAEGFLGMSHDEGQIDERVLRF